MYKNIPAESSFPELERETLEYWRENNIFEKSLELSDREFVFYDGPPFPTGIPHLGTIFVSILKDALARFFTMAGYSVPRRWGWDCHGLPIENAVEKKLGIEDKTLIEKSLGVAAFNDECRKLVSYCNDAWETYVRKVGRWVDYANAYRTLDLDYMESVLWVFRECYDKGLIYKDYRVTPYCYRCETALSVSDTRESDSTRPRQDPEIIVMFKAHDRVDGKDTWYLAWTTTPWTLASNLALAVGPDYRYAAIEHDGKVLIMAEDLLGRWSEIVGTEPVKLKTFSGSELAGRSYDPMFPYFGELAGQGCFRVLPADFVTLDDGVGIVHCAPAFGEEDYWLCKQHGLGVRNPVDVKGRFIGEVPDFAGRNVHECNTDVIKMLRKKGVLLLNRTLEHNYPHCWRCRTPLIYRAMDAWYFAVEKIKPRLIERNEDINWVPAHVKHGRFGKWLAGARDWNISRMRYWGTPVPVWECSNTGCAERRVLGSIAEIVEAAGRDVADLHKEHLDNVEFKCGACGDVMRRVPEVLDCWFESGAMPFGQCHYPFENKEWFESHFPADFIVEYPGQIRCWFYYLHVLAVALLDRAAFRNCLVHGTLLSEEGAKISKSQKNFTDPMRMIDDEGADALRLYLLNSQAVVMEDLNFKDSGVKEQTRRVLLPLRNAFSFFVTYAGIDGYSADMNAEPESDNALDRWILAVLYNTEKKVKQAFSEFRLNQSLGPVVDFIEALTNWYIRQSRRRFWSGGLTRDKRNAFDTLNYALVVLVKLLAPSAPFISETIFRNLTGGESVHLSRWPDVPERFRNDRLIEENKLARLIVSLGLALRQKAGIKARMPLPGVRVALPRNSGARVTAEQEAVIKNELNVKRIEFMDDPDAIAVMSVSPNPRILGPKYGADVQKIIRAARSGNTREEDGRILVFDGADEWVLAGEEAEIAYRGKAGSDVASEGGVLVELDGTITPELREEGIVNELNRIIQDMRKSAGYAVSDRVWLGLDGELADWGRRRLAEWALADLARVGDSEADIVKSAAIEGRDFRIAVKKK